MYDDGVATSSSQEQQDVERDVDDLYRPFWRFIERHGPDTSLLGLHKEAHADFLRGALGALPASFAGFDPIRPWVTFWATHGLNLLGARHHPKVSSDDVVAFLGSCQHPNGGYGGGPYQIAHLGTTYAAVATLVSLGTDAALQSIDVPAVERFLNRMCISVEEGGGMTVHDGGETDARSCYLSLATAYMLNLDCDALASRAGIVQYLCRCQTYEGGLGGEPGNEAHGGYTYCGLAALAIIKRQSALDLHSLLSWAMQRQSAFEGGFNGRTNKLVDGCYSFWQGALFSLIDLDEVQIRVPEYESEGMSSDAIPELPDFWQDAPPDAQSPDPDASATLSSSMPPHSAAEASRCTPSDADAAVLRSRLDALSSELPQRKSSPGAAGPSSSEGKEPASAAQAARRSLGTDAPYHALALQLWILLACQTDSGLRDKPGKNPDFYHTCYCLSGLSLSQQAAGKVLGGQHNALLQTDPRLNVLPHLLQRARAYFSRSEAVV